MTAAEPESPRSALEAPPYEDKPVPLWQKIAAGAVFVIVVILVVAFHRRLAADFWPLDASRVAPNLLASLIQWAIVFLAAILIWPPTRRRLHRFVDRKLEPVHAHLTAIKDHHEKSAERQRLLLKQNAHIIANSKTLKNTHADGTDLTVIPEHL